MRLRDRLFPVLTVSIAFLWALGTMRVAEYVGSMNTARALAAIMAAPMSSGSSMSSFTSNILNMQPSHPTASQVQEQRKLTQQITTVEVVVYVWRVAMLILAGILWMLSLLSVITGRFRLWHLCAAFLILASTLGTLIGLWLLTRPEWGGMPPLSVLSYICVGAVQAAYGMILLIAFARKPSFGRAVRISTVDHSIHPA